MQFDVNSIITWSDFAIFNVQTVRVRKKGTIMNKIPFHKNNKIVCFLQRYFSILAGILLSLLFSLCVVHYTFGQYTSHYVKHMYRNFVEE